MAVPDSGQVTRFSDVVPPLLVEPPKEMLVLHGSDLKDMRHELSAEVVFLPSKNEKIWYIIFLLVRWPFFFLGGSKKKVDVHLVLH